MKKFNRFPSRHPRTPKIMSRNTAKSTTSCPLLNVGEPVAFSPGKDKMMVWKRLRMPGLKVKVVSKSFKLMLFWSSNWFQRSFFDSFPPSTSLGFKVSRLWAPGTALRERRGRSTRASIGDSEILPKWFQIWKKVSEMISLGTPSTAQAWGKRALQSAAHPISPRPHWELLFLWAAWELGNHQEVDPIPGIADVGRWMAHEAQGHNLRAKT